ncbi:thioredoxin domain-containing protein [Candidatus Daviesbacteria bacterium]|nr:thioredoxin domain-containing protein [Candidatus Daviesbacteria bacterium]
MTDKNSFLTTPLAILLGCLVIAVAILLHGGIIKVGKVTTGTAAPAQPPQVAQPAEPTKVEVEKLRADDHIRGNKNARILLIEYSDLECPFCKRFHPTAQQAVSEYKGQVAWVYRHFPLDQIHSKADKEAEATECAAELSGNDGFWKMTDKIFEVTPSNNGLNLDDLPKLAAQVGLDQNKFKACLDSGKYAAHVEEDYQSGIKAGVTGTPGNILLDTKSGKTIAVPGAVPFEQLKPAIDSLLQS